MAATFQGCGCGDYRSPWKDGQTTVLLSPPCVHTVQPSGDGDASDTRRHTKSTMRRGIYGRRRPRRDLGLDLAGTGVTASGTDWIWFGCGNCTLQSHVTSYIRVRLAYARDGETSKEIGSAGRHVHHRKGRPSKPSFVDASTRDRNRDSTGMEN